MDFLIVAFVIFLLVRWFNRLKARLEPPAPAPATRSCPYCVSAIPVRATLCPFCTSDLRAA